MLIKKHWIFSLLLTLLVAAEANACMAHKQYPALWRNPPLYSGMNEVVLKVQLSAYSFPDRGEQHLWSSCDGGAEIFRVVEVLKGQFTEKEVAIVHPMIGGFRDAPDIGETRYIVGRPLGSVTLNERYVDNALELKKQGTGQNTDEFLSVYETTLSGGPSTVIEVRPRPPIEQRALFLFGNPRTTAGVFVLALVATLMAFVFRIVVKLRKSTAFNKSRDGQNTQD